jgi:predicted phosphodiesterase
MTPDEALDVFEDEILELVKGKVLGMVSGNHENRTKRQSSTDLLRRTAKRFSIPYDPEILVLDLTIGQRNDGTNRGFNYVVAFGHGNGGGRQTGGKINAAQRLTSVVNNADLLITGHSHQPAWWKVPCGSVDRRNKNYVVNSIPNMIIPAWLGYEEYAQRKFYPPSPFAEVKVMLSGKEKDMTFILK